MDTRKISVGLKRYPKTLGDIEKFSSILDYIEVMSIEGEDISKLHKLDIPITLHNPHSSFGFNPCDKDKFELNFKILNASLKLADEFGSKIVVVHPGRLDKPWYNVDNAYEFFSDNFLDKRIHFENLFSAGFSSKEDFLELFKRTKNNNMCFDIGHAFIAAHEVSALDIDKYVLSFFDLNPKYFHFSGIKTKEIKDHFNFCDNDYDFSKIAKFVPSDSMITLETNHLDKDGNLNTNEQIKDLEFVRWLF
ncbi:MAG: TIM barrel protein [Candidatus Woesearchaeota archaeon]|jgi:sugar phosphate isomerase/epimerase